jgi:predicted MFS family arabinose efflux permease
MLVVGYTLYGLVYLGFAIIPGESAAWGLFAVYGLYMGLTEGIEKALIAQLAPPDQRATVLGLHAAIVGLGLLPASILAGLLWEHAGPAAPFMLGGALGLAAAVALWWKLQDVPPQHPNSHIPSPPGFPSV